MYIAESANIQAYLLVQYAMTTVVPAPRLVRDLQILHLSCIPYNVVGQDAT